MKLVSHLIWVTSTIALLLLAGCAGAPKPPIAQISLNVQPTINPYSDGTTKPQARPVVIRIYELTSLAAFNTSDFFSVFYKYKETLSSELLSSEEFQLSPDVKLKFNKKLHLDTRYIGVVSAFKDLENAQWRAAAVIPPSESDPEVYVLLKENKVLVGAKEPCGFFCRIWSPEPSAGSLYERIEP